MDSLTQATLGALCGELLLRKQLGWKGAAWGLFFGTLPDLDLIAAPVRDSLVYLKNHRGVSHSLFLMLLVSPLFGRLLAKLHHSLSAKRASLFVLLTWSTHVLIDCFNSYGTQVFEPFSDQRVTLNNMSIIDPLFTLPMVVGVIWALFKQKESQSRSRIVTITTSWIVFYTLLSFTFLGIAQRQFERQLSAAGITADASFTSCTLGNIFLWRTLARDPENYYVSYWSVFDSSDRLVEIDTIKRTPELVAPYRDSEAFKMLDWFSQGWWKVAADGEDGVILVDMRFGETHQIDGENSRKIPPFLWRLSLDAEGAVQQSRMSLRGDFNPKPVLSQLLQRIAGGAPNWMDSPWPWDTTKAVQSRQRN